MTRCPHCKKLTHSEILYVEFDIKDIDKINELKLSENWRDPWSDSKPHDNPRYFGRLKCCDIWINFIAKESS